MAIGLSDTKPRAGLSKWIRWTGFPDKTLWDWMQLLIVPIVLGGGAVWFQVQASSTARQNETERADAQRTVEIDRARQSALQAYLGSISVLLLDKNLADPSVDTAVREIARANTLSTLRQLDPERKRLLITFAYDSKLIGFTRRPSEREQIDGDPTEESLIAES